MLRLSFTPSNWCELKNLGLSGGGCTELVIERIFLVFFLFFSGLEHLIPFHFLPLGLMPMMIRVWDA